MAMTQKRSCSGTRAANRWRDESGSILIPVAVCLLGLLAFSAFTVDNGIMLSSRRQAQNAADAGVCPPHSTWPGTTTPTRPVPRRWVCRRLS